MPYARVGSSSEIVPLGVSKIYWVLVEIDLDCNRLSFPSEIMVANLAESPIYSLLP